MSVISPSPPKACWEVGTRVACRHSGLHRGRHRRNQASVKVERKYPRLSSDRHTCTMRCIHALMGSLSHIHTKMHKHTCTRTHTHTRERDGHVLTHNAHNEKTKPRYALWKKHQVLNFGLSLTCKKTIEHLSLRFQIGKMRTTICITIVFQWSNLS